jgi:hypothetical protein
MILRAKPDEKLSWFCGLAKAWCSLSCFSSDAIRWSSRLVYRFEQAAKKKQLHGQFRQFGQEYANLAQRTWSCRKALRLHVGVHPTIKAKVWGCKLMERLNDLADSKSMKCYTRMQRRKTKAFYESLATPNTPMWVLTDITDKSRSIDGRIMIRQPKSTKLVVID